MRLHQEWVKSLVKESFLKDYPVEVIPNGIDTSVFKPTHGDFRKKYGLENKFIILGVANVWEERKGLKHFLELASMLKQDEVIVLVGLNKKQIKKLPRGIIGIERTNSARELAEIYATADVFVNPTLEDNYPTVNLEAQACGTYVITFDSGGAKETLLKVGFTGTYLSNKTSQELRNCIDHLRRDLTLVRLKNQPLFLEKQLDATDFAKAYVELYDKVLSTNFRTEK
ncbi:MAG: glycosyltransferase [candidate division WOR-3 bacterium]